MMAASFVHSGYRLSDLLDGSGDVSVHQDREITHITLDSRQVGSGSAFFACAGTRQHGLDYLQQAIERGAAAIIYEPDNEWTRMRVSEQAVPSGVSLIAVEGLHQQVSRIAGRFYGQPSASLSLVGFTGTNGKTSCSQFLAQTLEPATHCGVIGTLGNGFLNTLKQSIHTTPDPIELQSLLADMVRGKASVVAMEVSSHALDQARVEDLQFDVAVLTNLSRDHLDYHGSMDEYAAAKRRLFEMPNLSCAVLNLDDEFGRQLHHSLGGRVPVIGYSLDDLSGNGVERWLSVTRLAADSAGMRIGIDSSWGGGELQTALLGRFNVSNLLAVLAVLLERGLPLGEALDRLSGVRTVAGRMESFGSSNQPLVVVDYAHTPDALAQTLLALRPHAKGRLICLFGCGGERDKGKRPEMGRVAEECADLVYVTDDNPRTEASDLIIQNILDGMVNAEKAVVIANRKQAVESAIKTATVGDVVLVAGKGHEDYQQIGDLRVSYSDRLLVESLLAEGKS